MEQPHYRHHGSVFAGRVIVVAGCALVFGANALVFMAGARPPTPLPILQVLSIISLVWMYAGAWVLCTKKALGRYLMLAVLYCGSLGFFVTGLTALTTPETPLAGRLTPIFLAAGVYILVSLVVTFSKHVARLTSREWE